MTSGLPVLSIRNLLYSRPHWIAVLSCSSDQMVVSASLVLDSGRCECFVLRISWERGGICVREAEPRSLPTFCPERHIQADGSFCLAYDDSAAQIPMTVVEAERWWKLLHGYLRLQYLAGRRRKWMADAWPHGSGAAVIAQELDTLKERLPRNVVAAASQVGIVQRSGRVRFRRRACPCGSSRPARSCHEKDIVRLVRLKQRIAMEESRFWTTLRRNGVVCCGTMMNCPLGA